jgi:hypothetical protein
MRTLGIAIIVAAWTCVSGCGPHALSNGIIPGTDHEVHISPLSGGPNCTVDRVDKHTGNKDATVYLPVTVGSITLIGGDQIHWCVDKAVSTQYYINFTATDPFATNDFPVSKNSVSQELCSDSQSPKPGVLTGSINGYPYQVQYFDGQNLTACTDPKVIFK